MDRFYEIGRLSEAEAEVMREIWVLASPVTVSQMLTIFSARRGWKPSTLQTIMDRLTEKGFLKKTPLNGKTNIFKAIITEVEYKGNETEMFIASVHKGSLKSFIAALAESKKISADEIADVRAWFLEKAGEE